jgi:hypothetical protein
MVINLYHLPNSIFAIILASMREYQLAYARPVCHTNNITAVLECDACLVIWFLT